MDDRDTVVEALAVRDGRITAIGTDAEISRCSQPRTRRVDLQGRSVVPGLVDVHTHAIEWTKGIVRGEIATGYPAVRSARDINPATGTVRTMAVSRYRSLLDPQTTQGQLDSIEGLDADRVGATAHSDDRPRTVPQPEYLERALDRVEKPRVRDTPPA